MAENEAPQGAPEVVEPQNDAPKETDWKAEARKWESRAKENLSAAQSNADAAKRLAEIEEANKTAEQKQAERMAQFERENAELKSAKLRAEVAAAKGVPAALLTGSTQEELEAAADALIEFRGEPQKPKLHLPNLGNQPNVSSGSTAEQFAEFMQDKLS